MHIELDDALDATLSNVLSPSDERLVVLRFPAEPVSDHTTVCFGIRMPERMPPDCPAAALEVHGQSPLRIPILLSWLNVNLCNYLLRCELDVNPVCPLELICRCFLFNLVPARGPAYC